MQKKIKKTEGLGDTIDILADRIAKLFGKEDCGCDRRRKKLNKLVPYNKKKK